MIDIERGKVSKLERVLSVWRNVLGTRKSLLLLFGVWVGFCMILWGVPDLTYHYLTTINYTAAANVVQDRLPVDITTAKAVAVPEDIMKRFEYVRSHVELYDGVKSSLYDFNGRLRNDIDIMRISAGMEVVIAENDFYCLAGVHIGFPKHIMKIGGRLYVNSKIVDQATETFLYNEESAFYPGLELVKKRYKTIDLEYYDDRGYIQHTHLETINAICAQHLLETMNGHKFKVLDEL